MGIMVARYIVFPPYVFLYAFITAAVLLGIAYVKAFRFPSWYGIGQACFWMVFGACLYFLNRFEHKDNFIGKHYHEGALISAIITSAPEPKPKSWKTEASLRQYDSVRGQWVSLSGGAILYFAKDSNVQALEIGSKLAFRKKLQPIRNSGNPGGFNYRAFAADKGLFYQLFLRNEEFIVSETKAYSFWKTWPAKARGFLMNTLRENITGPQTIGVAEALLTGYRGDMDKELSMQYAGTGAAHIIAISGLHLGMIQVAIFFILKPLTRLKHGKNIRAAFVILFLWVFAIISGAGASVLRSALMFSILLFGEVIGRKGNSYNSLSASAFLLLLYNPDLLFDVGFQLSYSAVLSIFIFNAPIEHLWRPNHYLLHKVWSVVAITLSAQILTLPFVVYYFHQFPVYFLLTNLIAIPLSWIALNLMLALTLVFWWAGPVAAVLGKAVDISIHFMNVSIAWIDHLPLSRIENIYLPLPQAILIMGIIACLASWLLLRRNTAAVGALFGIAAMVLYREMVWQQQKKQRILVVYNIPNHLAIDIIEGHKSFFAGDAECLRDQAIFRNQIQPARIKFQINSSTTLPVDTAGFTSLQVGGKKLLMLDKEPDIFQSAALETDILLLAANIRAKPTRVLEKIKCKSIIVSSKMPFYRLPQWQIAADSLHLPLHSVADNGAFLLDLKSPGP
jgi:competence protein ComEC